ncbi:MAG: c-type cytochrome [Myxococcales bacterium]|nr:c-type cytochrome [Myxococcales bacterium]
MLALGCSSTNDKGTTEGETGAETQSTDGPLTSSTAPTSAEAETADDPDEGTPSGGVCPDDSTLTWATFGEKFFTDYCTRCHSTALSGVDRQGAPDDHNFDTVELVRTQIEHIDGQAAAGPNSVNTLMPIGDPKPTEDERKKLAEWLACGAP